MKQTVLFFIFALFCWCLASCSEKARFHELNVPNAGPLPIGTLAGCPISDTEFIVFGGLYDNESSGDNIFFDKLYKVF